MTCTPEIVPQAVPLYEDRVKASVGDPEAAAAGVAVVTATAGTAHAAPLTRVRRPTPFSAGMLQPSLRAMVWGWSASSCSTPMCSVIRTVHIVGILRRRE
ncbi:hypothetical protein [Rathayibacter rathayi]|uniref:hypothetical protein n=1 Tax=Rathayibacter rathayi TaxID=33887 RepID=UPI0011B05CC4|nr:hypothetical protein [Rathayibacter rathayi]